MSKPLCLSHPASWRISLNKLVAPWSWQWNTKRRNRVKNEQTENVIFNFTKRRSIASELKQYKRRGREVRVAVRRKGTPCYAYTCLRYSFILLIQDSLIQRGILLRLWKNLNASTIVKELAELRKEQNITGVWCAHSAQVDITASSTRASSKLKPPSNTPPNSLPSPPCQTEKAIGQKEAKREAKTNRRRL
ncbi:hypothetical protein AX14_001809 [Amanita brunnescens Koide BX004]|nr:hypothetical protein AX14_001809 [Amanita brunnescens Koide BX004]